MDSCWGCGYEYLGNHWTTEDLVPHPTVPGDKICPSCFEELPQEVQDAYRSGELEAPKETEDEETDG